MSETLRFALIGAAGFVAPRHMNAIKNAGHQLVAALDPNDSVGVIDSYFPKADFFTEFERFDRHIDKLRRRGDAIDYVSICSPNYLHDAHIRFALRSGANAICEKPLVLNPWNVDALAEIAGESDMSVYNILQLRLHPAVRALRDKVATAPSDKVFDVDLAYLTMRGHWYRISWKGDEDKSGGIVTNIGVHFFDMLQWVFGDLASSHVHLYRADAAAGHLEYERARVRWFLSINGDHLPPEVAANGKRTYRSITVDGEALEFSDGFEDLHTASYEAILAGNGFTLEEARPSIEAVSAIRDADVVGIKGDVHPLVNRMAG